MKGVLIYDAQGASRNEFFIKKLISAAEARNITLELCIYDTNFLLDKDVDFAVVRTIEPDLSAHIEQSGVRVFNNSDTSRIANDKWLTYLMCRELGIPTAPTYDRIPKKPLLPCIVKSRNGHGGAEVYLTANATELSDTCNALTALGKTYIVQELGELGRDMRLYVLGGKPVASVLRTSETNFRSNFSLGGKCELAPPTAEQLEICDKIYKRSNCDYVGIDFIRYNGKWVLNEIEDVVGARMLYSLTDIDIAEKYIEHIIRRVS